MNFYEMVGPWDRNSSSELTFHGNKDEEFHERWVQERRLIRSGHRNPLKDKPDESITFHHLFHHESPGSETVLICPAMDQMKEIHNLFYNN